MFTKVRPSYDPSCAIFSSFNFKVIFNIASADIVEIERTEDFFSKQKL